MFNTNSAYEKVITDFKQTSTGERLEYIDQMTYIKNKFGLTHGKGKRKKKKKKR